MVADRRTSSRAMPAAGLLACVATALCARTAGAAEASGANASAANATSANATERALACQACQDAGQDYCMSSDACAAPGQKSCASREDRIFQRSGGPGRRLREDRGGRGRGRGRGRDGRKDRVTDCTCAATWTEACEAASASGGRGQERADQKGNSGGRGSALGGSAVVIGLCLGAVAISALAIGICIACRAKRVARGVSFVEHKDGAPQPVTIAQGGIVMGVPMEADPKAHAGLVEAPAAPAKQGAQGL